MSRIDKHTREWLVEVLALLDAAEGRVKKNAAEYGEKLGSVRGFGGEYAFACGQYEGIIEMAAAKLRAVLA